MNFEQFKDSLAGKRPPQALTAAERALWWEAKGDWGKAHRCAQEDDGKEAAWVHAYLHRKEGDPENAGCWYRRAGKPAATVTFALEWDAIARALLKRP